MTRIEHDLFDLWVNGGLSEPSLKALEDRRHLDCTQLNTIEQNCTQLHTIEQNHTGTNTQRASQTTSNTDTLYKGRTNSKNRRHAY